MPNDVPDWTLSIQGQVAGEVEAADFKCDGLVGSQVATRWVGAVNGAAPTQIDSIGDHAWDEQGGVWVQTGGTLATWVWVPSLSAAGDLVLPSAGRGSGNASLAGQLKVTGGSAVSDATAQSLRVASGYGTPTAARLLFGDGTGWKLSFARGNTNAPTEVGYVNDTGQLSGTDFRATGVHTAVAADFGGAVNGGPPGFNGDIAGQVIVDYRWGIVWVWDATNTRWLPCGGPGPYTARMYRSAAQNLGAGVSVIPFDTIDWDPNNNCTTGVSAGYTAPITGRYRVTVLTSSTNTGSGALRSYASIFVNGVEVARGQDNTLTNLIFSVLAHAVVNATAGQAIQGEQFFSAGPAGIGAGQALCYMLVQWEGPQ